MSNDYFEHKAASYEEDKNRVENVKNIAQSILDNVGLDKSMHLMDFGSGTGLLLEKIAPSVNKITAVDISKSMNKKLEDKRKEIECELEIVEMDLSKTELKKNFDGIISSMTLHHVENINSMFNKFHSMLNKEGVLAIADLDLEDGSFHTEDTGVFHFGFDRKTILNSATEAGFRNVKITTASAVQKPQGSYPVFLLTGEK